MTYYAFIQDNKINGTGECPVANEEIANFEITEEVYNNIDHYIWDGSDVVLDPDYDEKQAQKEAEEAELNSNHFENFNFEPVGVESALLLDRAMSEGERYFNFKRGLTERINTKETEMFNYQKKFWYKRLWQTSSRSRWHYGQMR